MVYVVTKPFSLQIKAPRLMQSVFSALGDLYLYKLSDALYGVNVASWSVSSFYAPC